LRKPFALVIEDNRDTAALFSIVLDLIGFETQIIYDGKTALARLEFSAPDLVLLDLHLADSIGGEYVLHRIRSDERLKDINVIVVTAFSNLAKGLDEEADLILYKPISVDQLSDLVARFRPDEDTLQTVEFDSLTGLYNATYFKNRLLYNIERAKRMEDYLYAAMCLEFTEFKTLADRHGQSFMDQLLIEGARRVSGCLRPSDTVAYFGENQFYIILEGIKQADGPLVVAERLKAQLGDFPGLGKGKTVEVSLGIVLGHPDFDQADELLKTLVAAKDKAKNSGGLHYESFGVDLSKSENEIVDKVEVEKDS
jgi:diguanylate cyclase (GGDEF)-like protein